MYENNIENTPIIDNAKPSPDEIVRHKVEIVGEYMDKLGHPIESNNY